MEISTSQVESAAVIRCEGRHNLVAAPRLRSAIDSAVDSGQARVVVDLRIAEAGEQVRTVLGLTNLDRLLRPHDRVEDALDGW